MGAAEEIHPDLQGLLGTTIAGRYRVDAIVGEGGMGAVFRGHHLGLKRDVAIKVLHPDLLRDSEISARFDREAHSASRLEHPNCLQVTDVGVTDSGLKFMVMQLLEGRELATLLGVEIGVERSLLMMLQVLRGLEHAHEKGVIHRDVKPENIFITEDHEGREVLKLVDFGIAKLVGSAADGQRKMTKAGLVFGTPAYMSPEQALGQEADGRADLYSVGIILYEMINGKPPFMNDDAVALVRMQVTNDPPPLAENVPAIVVDFIWRLLAKQREERFQSASEAREALETIIPMVVPTDVIIAAGFGVTGSGPFTLPGSSGLLPLPGTSSQPIMVGGPGSSAAIRLRSTSSPSLNRSLDRVPTLGRLAMEPPPPGLPDVAPTKRRRWLALGGIVALLGVAGIVAVNRDRLSAGSDAPPEETTSTESADTGPVRKAGADARGPDAGKLAELDRLLLAGNIEDANKLLRPLLDQYPEHAPLVWRHGRLLAQGRKTRDKALAVYGRALDLDPSLIDDRDFYDQMGDLLRLKNARDEALDIALRQMGPAGHRFLLELVNNERRPLGFSDRHRALDELATDPNNTPLVNWRLNKALDLLQATQSLTPCESYASALGQIESDLDAWYLPRVQHAPVPTPKAGEEEVSEAAREDAAKCEGLEARRAALLASLAMLDASGETEGSVVIAGDETGGEAGPAAPAPAPEPAKKKAPTKKSTGTKKKPADCSKPFVGLSKKCR